MKDNWEEKKLKEVCHVITDGTHKTPKYTDEGIRFISIKNIKPFRPINWQSYVKYISREEHNELIKRCKPELNDILFPRIGTLGYAKKIDFNEEVSLFVGLGLLKPNHNIIESSFLEYYMNSPLIYKLSHEKATGSGRQTLALKSTRDFPVPIPTNLEQKEIVEILDQAFKSIDKAKANIEKNIENAKELFQSKLNQIFSKAGQGWKKNTLKEVTTKIGSGATPRGGKSSYKETGISLIRSMNVYDIGFKKKNLAFIDDEQAAKLNNVTVEQEDVLLNITGASVARCCIVPKEYLPARVNQHVSIIRLDGKIIPNFVHYSLTSKYNKKLLLGIGEEGGSTRQAITKSDIESFVISYPIDKQKQKEIVETLDIFDNHIQSVLLAYNEELENLEVLKKSILQKAFSGELTNKNKAA